VKISKLKVGKGRSQESADGKSWERVYYEVEVELEDQAEVEEARSNVLSLMDGWLSQPTGPPQPTATPDFFPEDLHGLLSFEETEDEWIVRPKRFLGKENFVKVAAIVEAHKGKYVSAGKESHFVIPK